VLIFGNMMGHIIIVERTIATLNSVKYEKQKGPWFSIFWISIMVKLKKRLDLLLKIIPKVLVVFSISDFRGFFFCFKTALTRHVISY